MASAVKSPWHSGELQMQRELGVANKMDELGRRVIRDHLPDQHRAFFAQLPFVVVGAVDSQGDPWATLLAQTPGFMQASTDKLLRIDSPLDPLDPATSGLADGGSVGLLGMEPATRRRNRMNGTISDNNASGFSVNVVQSFGNCPQYIQARDFQFVRDPASLPEASPLRMERLSDDVRELVANADTFFVASYVDNSDGRREVDVSHRGGRAGFVRIEEDGSLTVPDFAGNLFFATLGNILINPRAGLAFVDFETGDLLQLSGRAKIITESPEIAAFQGAERLWTFAPERIVYRPGAIPLRWTFQANGWSPNSLMTGSWEQAAERLKASALKERWRKFKVAKILDESSVIRSFHFEPIDGAGLIPHLAGQHLPIRVTPAACEKPAIRTYTLSCAPADGIYRISVKREGLVSSHLHDNLRVGDIIEARAPAGQFTIDAFERRPAVLLAAGVGVTPMLAMLRHVVYEGLRTRRVRPTWFFLSARSIGERAFAKEIERVSASANGLIRFVRVLSNTDGARECKDYDEAGRIDVDLLCRTLPFNDYDFYMCGPPAFMQSVYDDLRALNVADGRIHAEAFGPASLKRHGDVVEDVAPARIPSDTATPVMFVKSGKEARWVPDGGSLLDLAEARGLSPESGCRGGTCGTCRTHVVEGAVAYVTPPDFKVADDEALICCAVPANRESGGGPRLLLDI
ncbi:pyridoxamine 5'-phosphate oxidase family protein [Paraburkholderia azotifigens]|uniref:2Fe-2S iron-sulfur cluster binding domain-containing protein n=1 Tax=Paraburkholderia azotifigens TaxID=2057004 RepID=A0A5C6VIY3_9BURK|nr:pyridoxamine 5'-phosphate oxidase family protein [Paraburkholderia azotifigens]TXC83665.1 2Fe-2S iron-sulfur cluster binding domain-containing protein [Paraburkholderia azotifigens]